MQFGVIGCGTIGQIMHIPHIVEIPDAELYALSDISEQRVEAVGEQYGVENRFIDSDEMVAELGDELDAVIVLTPPQEHADIVEMTLGSDIHTFVEKPVAITLEDADRIVEAAERSAATAMVGYNKRFAPAYEATSEALPERDQIDQIHAYATDADHGRIIEEVYDLESGAFPDDLVEESQEKRERHAIEAIDSDDPDLAADYDWHLEHIVHDINALRGLFGEVESIDYVDLFADGRYAKAQLKYDDDIRCTLDSGIADRKWHEEFIRVDTVDGMLKLQYTNPFIKNSPAELQVKRGTERLSDETSIPSYAESFKLELEHFIDCIRGNSEVLTTVEEGRDDVRLIADLFRVLAGSDTVGSY